MKALKYTLYAASALVILALSAILFMWGALFFAPMILVPIFIAVTKGRAYFKINNPHMQTLITATGRPIAQADVQKAIHANISADECLDTMAKLRAQIANLKNNPGKTSSEKD